MSTPLDRFLLLLEVEGVKLPWLEERTGIKRKRWATVKAGSVEMRAAETEGNQTKQMSIRATPRFVFSLIRARAHEPNKTNVHT